MRHWHRQRRHSISGKLILLFVLMAVLFVVLVSSSISLVFSHHFEHNLKPHLIQYMEYVQRDIGNPADRDKARALAQKLHITINVIDPHGNWSTSGKPFTAAPLVIRHQTRENGINYGIATIADKEYFLASNGATVFLYDIPNLHPRHKGLGLLPIIMLLLVLMLLYHFTHRIIRPVAVLKAGIKRIGGGELDHRITINSRDELSELATSINEMADDIQQMLEAKRQLLLAISHELRSPLTRAKVSLELLSDEDQGRALGRDLDEMESLIEELLETERLSTRHRVLNRQLESMQRLIADVIAYHFADAGISVDMPSEELVLCIDVARIKLLVKNLLENALRHTSADAQRPGIKLLADTAGVQLVIHDHGEGIDSLHIPHITEPFYRADSARQRETGGYGLGLYLCRVITEAHDGELRIESRLGQGTSVTIRLPIGTGCH